MSSTIAFTRERKKKTHAKLFGQDDGKKMKQLNCAALYFWKIEQKHVRHFWKIAQRKREKKIPQKNDINRCDERV